MQESETAARSSRAIPPSRQTAAHEAALASIVDVIEAGDPTESMRRLLVHAAQTVGAERGSLSRIDGEVLVLEATHDPAGHAQPGDRSPLSEHPHILRALRSDTTVFVDDSPDGAGLQPGQRLRHSILQPLFVRGRAVGVLALSRRRAEPFEPEDLEVFSVFGRAAAVLFSNARLIAEKDQAIRDLRNLLEASVSDATGVARSLNATEIISSYVRRAQRLVDADRCTLTSLDRKIMRIEASHEGTGEPAWVGSEYPLSTLDQQPLLKRSIETGEIVTGSGFDLAYADPKLAPALEPIQQVAVLPLKIAEEVVALLILSRSTPSPFHELDLLKLQHIGSVAVLALRYARALEAIQIAQQRGLDALRSTSEHMASSEEINAFFGKISATVARLVGASKAAFWIIKDGAIQAQPDSFGFDSSAMAQMRISLDKVPSALRIAGGEPIKGTIEVPDPGRDPEVDAFLGALDVKEFIAVPWHTAGQTLGVVTAFDSSTRFTDEDVWVLRLVARASALVWQADQAERRVVEVEEREKARLQATASRAEQLEKVKSEFLRLASHELRGPLSLAKGYVSLLEEGVFGALPEPALASVEMIEARLNQMGLLIDQLLDAARLEDSRLALVMRPTDLGDVIRAAWDALEPLKGPHHVMVLELRTTKAEVLGDPDKLQTIVANLLSNAIKYSPAGGEIRLRLDVKDGLARIAVIDHGIGIPADQHAQLFQKFGRVDRPETAAIGGTGLGLYLSQELAHRHGGEITVRSRPGKETVFTIKLPLLRRTEIAPPAP